MTIQNSFKKLKVEYWPINELRPYPNNPRDNDAAIDQMCESIKEFGFRIPIIVSSDGEVCDGHLRLKAAIKMGLKEVPVTSADELTPAQVKAFRLLANHSATWAEWNTDSLKLELKELEALEFDVGAFGLDEILPELVEVEPIPRKPKTKTTLFISVKNQDADRARKVIATALEKAKIDHNL